MRWIECWQKFFLGLLVLSVVVSAPVLHACSGDFPDIGFLAPASVEIPKNARGLLWSGVLRGPKRLVELPPIENFRISQRVGDRWVELPVKINLVLDRFRLNNSLYDVLLVGPSGPLDPGDTYRFVYYARATRCLGSPLAIASLDSQIVFVEVSEEEFSAGRPLVQRAGLVQRGNLCLSIGGSCSIELPAEWVDVDNVLPAEFQKWEDSFFYSVRVEGRVWHPRTSLLEMLPPGRSWVGVGRERFYRVEFELREPNSTPGLEGAQGMALMFAWLPGTTERQSIDIPYSFDDGKGR